MLPTVEGFWISAQVRTGDFSNSYFHVFDPPGRDVYATISLSDWQHFPMEPERQRRASAYIERWTQYAPDGRILTPDSMGLTQNAVLVRNCRSLEFRLLVVNWVSAIAQINIFMD